MVNFSLSAALTTRGRFKNSTSGSLPRRRPSNIFYRLLQQAVHADPVPYNRLVGGESTNEPQYVGATRAKWMKLFTGLTERTSARPSEVKPTVEDGLVCRRIHQLQ